MLTTMKITGLLNSRSQLGSTLTKVQGQFQAHILLCFALLHFADAAFFYKLKVCGKPATTKCSGTIFPKAFAHFVSVSHL